MLNFLCSAGIPAAGQDASPLLHTVQPVPAAMCPWDPDTASLSGESSSIQSVDMIDIAASHVASGEKTIEEAGTEIALQRSVRLP